MASTVYVGLAVTSHSTSATATATFTNVTARGGDDRRQSAADGVDHEPGGRRDVHGPATMTIGASAIDSDGTIAKVDFYRGSTLIASDTTNSYSATWTNAPAGTYQLTAVATDNDGVTTHLDTRQRDRQLGDQPGADGGAVVASVRRVVHGTGEHHGERDGVRHGWHGRARRVLPRHDPHRLGHERPYSAVWSGATAGTYALTARRLRR